MVKSAISEVEKPLEMGPDLQKKFFFLEKKKGQISSFFFFFFFFKGEKSLDMGRGFRPRSAHLCQKIIRVPPGLGIYPQKPEDKPYGRCCN